MRAKTTLTLLVTMTTLLSSGCTRPGKTTAVGSGVGGAIGAGLGAIVGNQSGNPGSGLAIGAAAGAATGAIIGNALQLQEERSKTQDEAMKRQERVIAAQKSEIAELRQMSSVSDTNLSYSNNAASTARYRYRTPTVDPESPEVARQRAKLQQRGPAPRSGEISTKSFYSEPSYTSPTTPRAAAPRPSTTNLARYDVRSDLSSNANQAPTKTTQTKAQTVTNTPPPPLKATLPKPSEPAPNKASTNSLSETDLVVASTSKPAEAVKTQTQTSEPAKLAPASTNTSECKEALEERDRAIAASENSDKLFHLRRSLRLCPQNAALHHELGKVYASMDRPSDAENEYKQALSIDPSFSASKKALSDMLKDEVQF
jgi:outer membrane lipoprotein SlyB